MNHSDPVSVFLVDDDNLFLKSMEHHLMHTLDPHVQISSFHSGEECLPRLDEHTGFVVLDHRLNAQNPNAMNGLEALKKIKTLQPEARVIILSGQENMEVALEAIKSGAFDYIVKNDKAFSKIHNLIRNSLHLKPKRTASKILFWTVGFLLLCLLAYLLRLNLKHP
ncbi:MAG TPA: response regulator [Bacteroidia bacterium]|nr:response regulator [Bacteroidia bacterium]